jgi:hypothetical protein
MAVVVVEDSGRMLFGDRGCKVVVAREKGGGF